MQTYYRETFSNGIMSEVKVNTRRALEWKLREGRMME
jgi:hypothetical protein